MALLTKSSASQRYPSELVGRADTRRQRPGSGHHSGNHRTVLFCFSCSGRSPGSWRFPDAFPHTLSLFYWSKSLPLIVEPLITAGLAGLFSAFIAIILVLGCLENERYLSRSKIDAISRKSIWIIYLPLLVPQIGFLFGIQTVFTTLHLEGSWFSLVWVHLVFVLPYIFLTLATTYRTYDQRYAQVAAILSGSAAAQLHKDKTADAGKTDSFLLCRRICGKYCTIPADPLRWSWKIRNDHNRDRQSGQRLGPPRYCCLRTLPVPAAVCHILSGHSAPVSAIQKQAVNEKLTDGDHVAYPRLSRD